MTCGVELVAPTLVLTTGAGFSIVSLCIIFYLYYVLKIPTLKKHPTPLTVQKCWFDLVFVIQYLWMFQVPSSTFWLETHDDDQVSCNVNPSIWPMCFVTQFTLLGGELLFGVLSADIHIALTNPFSSFKVNSIYYNRVVYAIAFTSAVILVSMVPIKYGLSTDPMVWVADSLGAANPVKIGLFYMFMFMIYLYSAFIAFWARYQISKGLEETLEVRKNGINKQTKYVIGNFIFWTVLFAFQFINYLKSDFGFSHVSKYQESILRTCSAFLFASRGLFSLVIFLVSNQKEIADFFRKRASEKKRLRSDDSSLSSSSTLQDIKRKDILTSVSSIRNVGHDDLEEDNVQLNIALQKEIVRFTGLGIQKAVREVDDLIAAQSATSSGSNNFFGSKMPGDSFTFTVIDPELGKKGSRTTSLEHRVVDSKEEDREPSVSIERGNEERLSTRLEERSSTKNEDRNSAREKLSVAFADEDYDVEGHRVISNDTSGTGENRHSTPRVSEVMEFQMQNAALEKTNNENPRLFSATDLSQDLTKLSHRILQQVKSKILFRRNNFLFTDYSPKRFAKIRKLSGISNEEYVESFKETTLPSFSEGKSGAFLYFSSDRKYIVKTHVKSEFEKLLALLPDYEKYLENEWNNFRKPLITRFLGAHRIIMYDIPLYFVVMQNICPTVDEKYDLKGSWVNRHGSKTNKDNQSKRPKKTSTLLSKDTTGLNINNKQKTPLFLDNDVQQCFSLRPEVARAMARQIARDTKFLEKFNIMDYSLLVGVRRHNFEIFDKTQMVKDNEATDGSATYHHRNPYLQDKDGALHASVVEGHGTFYIGIIDVLQEWNWDKWNERMFKSIVLRKDANGLSTMEPESYRQRFMRRAVLDLFEFVQEEDVMEADLTSENSDVSSSNSTLAIVNAMSSSTSQRGATKYESKSYTYNNSEGYSYGSHSPMGNNTISNPIAALISGAGGGATAAGHGSGDSPSGGLSSSNSSVASSSVDVEMRGVQDFDRNSMATGLHHRGSFVHSKSVGEQSISVDARFVATPIDISNMTRSASNQKLT